MRISHFDHAEDNVPKQADLTWDFFTSNLGPHEYRPGGNTPEESQKLKELLPCFSPAEYPDDALRGKKNVLRVWMLVLDVDHLDGPTADWVLARLLDLKLAAVVYSSWSHARDPVRFRVIIPLDRPVPCPEWPVFWTRAITLFNSICDLRCKDASRIYFGPFAPIGTEAQNFYKVYPGAELSVDYVMSLPLPAGAAPDQVSESEQLRTKDAEAIGLLVPTWPWQRRHEAHLALGGGLLSSGFSNDRAINFACDVARGQDPNNEDRPKRQAAIEHTRAQLDAGEKITGWGTLATIIGYDVVERVRALVERAPAITDDQLRGYAKQLKRSKLDRKFELGEALERVCQARVFPEPLALRLAADLGQRFFEYDAHSIAEAFRPSLSVMNSEGEEITVEQIEKCIKAKQDETRQHHQESRQKKEKTEQFVEADKASRVREAYKNGRSHPYTAAELASWQEMIGTGHRWILQRDRTFYFFFNGSYKGPYSESEAHCAALRELSPASSAGVDIYKVTKDGADFKTLRQLVAEYGTVAEQVVVDLRAQIVTYAEHDRAIIEAPCPLRKLEPRYDPDVDRWLYELVGPNHYDDLKTWLAILPDVSFIRAALALIGEHSVGKSMLGLGGGGLWQKEGPTTLEQALASFNSAILRCPLVFADEHLPRDFRGNVPMEQLRSFIQATERPLNRKFLPSSKCLGATPLLIAAHDLDVLRPTENLSNNEVEGSVHRFLIMGVRHEAAEFLANLRPTTHERGWITEDVIARHIWWLYYNHPRASRGRFYFPPSSAEHAMWFAISGGGKSSFLRWLVSFLADRKKYEGDLNTLMLVRVYKGQLLVNIGGVLPFWDKYIGNERCPTGGLLSRMLAEISYPTRIQLLNGKKRMTNYRAIREEYLYTWAKNTDLITVEEIDAELRRDSTETDVGLILR